MTSKTASERRGGASFLQLRVPVRYQRDGRSHSLFRVHHDENPSVGRGVRCSDASRCREKLPGDPGVKLAALRLDIDGHEHSCRIVKIELLAIPPPGYPNEIGHDSVVGDLPPTARSRKRNDINLRAATFVGEVRQPATVGRHPGPIVHQTASSAPVPGVAGPKPVTT